MADSIGMGGSELSANGLNLAREAISSSLQRYFINNETIT